MAIFTTPTQKSMNQLLAFLNFHNHAKNQFIPSIHSSNTVNFRVLPPDWPHQFLTTPISKIFNLLIFKTLYQHAKNQLILSVHSWYTVKFRVQRPDWPHPLLTIPNQKNFNQLLIFFEFASTCKKWGSGWPAKTNFHFPGIFQVFSTKFQVRKSVWKEVSKIFSWLLLFFYWNMNKINAS